MKASASAAARREVLRHVRRLPVVRLPLESLVGSILARGVRAPMDAPPFDRSAMDGYAVAGGAVRDRYEVVGRIFAGNVWPRRLRPGEAVRIMTGAMVPEGAGRVIMQEHVERVGARGIRVIREDVRTHIRLRGEDARKGELLFSEGDAVTPLTAATLAAFGMREAAVIRRPRVGILVTGNELLRAGKSPQRGKIYNSNGPMLRALLSRDGVEVVAERHAGDSLAGLRKACSSILRRADALCIAGGVSVGDSDHVPEAIEAEGGILHVRKVAIQPGKPFTFATVGGKPVFAFPGNPVSVFVAYQLFAQPAIVAMQGRRPRVPVEEARLLGSHSRVSQDREQFVPVRYCGPGTVRPVANRGSGDIVGLSRADALMVVPAGAGPLRRGARVRIIRVDGSASSPLT